MSAADIESLDAGVLEAGQLAAEALARVELLEKRLGEMETAFALIGQAAGPQRCQPRPERHLTLVRPS